MILLPSERIYVTQTGQVHYNKDKYIESETDSKWSRLVFCIMTIK